MHKFADDVDMITTVEHYDKITEEMDHIGEWAVKNNLILNKSKTKMMIFSKGRTQPPPPIEGIERVATFKKL
jgi:hypothetical protein